MRPIMHGGKCGESCCLRVQNLSVKIGNDTIFVVFIVSLAFLMSSYVAIEHFLLFHVLKDKNKSCPCKCCDDHWSHIV